MAEATSLRERECERIAATLRYVADHIELTQGHVSDLGSTIKK